MLQDVTLDGACTHGHPRALLGARLYAAALWYSFRQQSPIRYGSVLDELLHSIKDWAASDWYELGPEWIAASQEAQGETGEYREVWAATVDECRVMLEAARRELGRGAVSSAARFLESIGATSRSTNGSGTVCAVSAVYIASRSAANPRAALSLTSRLKGADTDTLASMTMALLGALVGSDSFELLADEVQDAGLLRRLALDLALLSKADLSARLKRTWTSVDNGVLSRLVEELDSGKQEVMLPTQRNARVQDVTLLEGSSGGAPAYVLQSDEQQTLFIVGKAGARSVKRTDGARRDAPNRSHVTDIDIPVDSLKLLRVLFEEVLRFRPQIATERRLVYDGFTFHKLHEYAHQTEPVQLVLAVDDVKVVRDSAMRLGLSDAGVIVDDERQAGRLTFFVDRAITVIVAGKE